MALLSKIFGTHSSREIKRIMPIVEEIEDLADKYAKMSDEELASQTDVLKERLANGETTDDILPDAFSVVREGSTRILGLRHFPVQLVGGIVLHQGRIAEMKTGEGKTLVATLPAYLNALTGQGVHVVTVNDYLAKYQGEMMGRLYKFLGMSVGIIVHDLDTQQRRDAYMADITYGTNNEFGFDYLRDNMVTYATEMVQRGHAFAIVDEVDSILIDEARTPLIISGMGEKSTDLYKQVDRFVKTLKPIIVKELDSKEDQDEMEGDYIVEEKDRTAVLTARGVKKAEAYFNIQNLADYENLQLAHHINQAVKAHGVMKRDVDYVVKDGEVIIVDDFTGRLMFGRRYSEGLHQAIEAKENVNVERESKTLATITFQNYFRMYKKLSGMTGTALTEEEEFRNIYKLDVIEIPTNKPMIRIDNPDVVYKTENGKFRAVIRQIIECHEKGQPVLVGTVSIEKSELLSSMLKREGIPHQVLNAKHHEREAEIIAQAGKKGSVTIATNMAGRGTDIMLGGNADYLAKAELRKQGYAEELILDAAGTTHTEDPDLINVRKLYEELVSSYKAKIAADAEQVKAAGGLYIIGTERHEARRIDNQLRGRSGRQGDPGASRFYISLSDDLMRLFGGERIMKMVDSLGLSEDDPIEARILSNSIENAQKRIEGMNFERRKNVLQFDEVMNQQRELIYRQRKEVIDNTNIHDNIIKMLHDVVDNAVIKFTSGSTVPDDWDYNGLREYFKMMLTDDDLKFTVEQLNSVNQDYLKEFITTKAEKAYAKQEEAFGADQMRELERAILLKVVDTHWMDHIDAMDQLRRGIGLRAYGQRDPVIEYKFEGSDMFEEMVAAIKDETIRVLLSIRKVEQNQLHREKVAQPIEESHGDEPPKKATVRRTTPKVGRNDPCPCGSGLKYKKCCGK